MSKQGFGVLCGRYLKFAASTIAGTAVDMIVLWFCAHILLPATYWTKYWLSPVISFECAVFTNFVIAYFFVWNDRVSKVSSRSFVRHFGGYNLSCIGAFLVKMAILLLLEQIFHWDVLLCNIVALGFSGIVNFTMNECVVFAKNKKGKNNESKDTQP